MSVILLLLALMSLSQPDVLIGIFCVFVCVCGGVGRDFLVSLIIKNGEVINFNEYLVDTSFKTVILKILGLRII